MGTLWQSRLRLPCTDGLSKLGRLLTRRTPGGKDTWGTARGPMAIARLEAKRLGWRFEGPFKL
eukprot:5409132-Heterocapsa_arctica.AAC.1